MRAFPLTTLPDVMAGGPRTVDVPVWNTPRPFDLLTATPEERDVVSALDRRSHPVGTVVYRPYAPQSNKTTGKIIKVESFVMTGEWRSQMMVHAWNVYTLKCLDGQTRTFGDVDSRPYFNRYQNLITDHEKKLATHRARMTRAEAL